MPGYFAQPKGVAIDSEGHLYVVDGQFETVQIFDDQGQLLMDFGEEGNRPAEFWLPAGIFIDPADRIWIADSYNRRVQVFDYHTSAPVEVKP
jgi:DNA-binding beta-propeller fold protein YncE